MFMNKNVFNTAVIPTISIVVPVYKVEPYLRRCVDSILAQTFKDFELILVDDGSPDNSGIICDEYAQKDTRVRIIHKENGGVSSARNAGIEIARGEWLCFVDGDDVIDPTYLGDFKLESSINDLYIQGYKKVYNNEVKETHEFPKSKEMSYIEILAFMEDERIINSPCCKLYDRAIIYNNNILFDSNTSYGEDHIFSLEYVAHASTAHYSTTSGYYYMVNGNESLSHRVIPLKDITYYSKESRRKQLELYSKYKFECYLASINRRQEATITKTIREMFSNSPDYNDYQYIYKEYAPLIKNNGLYGLSMVRKLYMIMFGYLPPKISYFILKSFL